MQKSLPEMKFNSQYHGSERDKAEPSKHPRVVAGSDNASRNQDNSAVLRQLFRVVLAGKNFQSGFPMLKEELKLYGLVDRIFTHSRSTPSGETVLVFDIQFAVGQSRDDIQKLKFSKRVQVFDLSAYPVHAPYIICSGVRGDVTAETIIETVTTVLGNEDYEIYLFSGK